jgi:type VI secretion system protein ImpA
MATPPCLDFETLLAPVTGSAGSADTLRRALRVKRQEARAAEEACKQWDHLGPDFEGQPAPQLPDWRGLVAASTQAIATQAKDLWIAAWLIEALTRTDGFAGLRDGFRLVRELVEAYWDTIQPSPVEEEEGVEATVRMLGNLNGDVLVTAIQAIHLTEERGELRPVTSGTYREIDEQARQQLVAATPAEMFQEQFEDVEAAQQEFRRLCEVLEQRCGTNESGYSLAPASGEIRDALADCRSKLVSLCPSLTTADSAEEAATGEGTGEAQQPGSAAAPSASFVRQAVQSREEAFRVLEGVAEFFRRTEPHSPVSYALQQAVRWGRMPLPELMSELIPEDSARQELFRLTGIKDSDEGS